MPCCETAWILKPFTVAPNPIAAPLRVTSLVFAPRANSRSFCRFSAACSLFCFISGGITLTIASCTDGVEDVSRRRCSKRGKISATFSCSAPRCFDNAPRKTATPKRADSPAAAPAALSSNCSTAAYNTLACSSPCFSMRVMPAASKTSRSSVASGVPPEQRLRPCRNRNLKALMTSVSPCKLPPTRSMHRATVILEAASSQKRWVSMSSAVAEVVGSSNSESTSATAFATRSCKSLLKLVFWLAYSMSSMRSTSSASSPSTSSVSLARDAELVSNAPSLRTARAA
mmetsp:Transcript_16210/g.41202  ORF Transcript_16210/g.41202 Transcript_16210/m.41202 type:complete len:286 (-) Transcript_16210:420-1277(-)